MEPPRHHHRRRETMDQSRPQSPTKSVMSLPDTTEDTKEDESIPNDPPPFVPYNGDPMLPWQFERQLRCDNPGPPPVTDPEVLLGRILSKSGMSGPALTVISALLNGAKLTPSVEALLTDKYGVETMPATLTSEREILNQLDGINSNNYTRNTSATARTSSSN